jgi:predicted metal-dependent enzyme (double-stranded beta helix superfamily)
MGRALEQLIAGLDVDFSLPAEKRPHVVRSRLQAALDSSDLFFDCAESLLSQLRHQPETQFVFFDPRARYTLQLFCWPPGFGNEPHLHLNWTVSGMMVNSLLVFRSAVSAADCLNSKALLVAPGQAGVLIPPQFHCLRNVGVEAAITFHVFSLDGVRRDEAHEERRPTSALRYDHEDVLALAKAAAMQGGPRAIDVLRAAFSVVDNATRLNLVKLMCKIDLGEGVRMGRTLVDLVGGRDGDRLLAVLKKLEIDPRQG